MTTQLAIAGVALVALIAPALAARAVDRRVSPRIAAVVHVLSLIAAAVVPVALLVCLTGQTSLLASVCHGWLGSHGHPLRWAAVGVAASFTLWIGYAAAATFRATRRAMPGTYLRPEGRAQAPVYVLPLDVPVAYAIGVTRGQVVISRGLADLLDRDEFEAALAHEAAHVRQGHPQLLFIGEVVNRALGALPPVRRAFASLRRELEAAADDQAVKAVGDPAIVAQAIAKVGLSGLAATPGAALGESDVAYRIRRLLGRRPDSRFRAAMAFGLAGVLAGGLVVSQCSAIHPGALWLGIMACAVPIAWVASRPLRPILS